MARNELELLTGICDNFPHFATQVLRHESSEWVELSIESDFNMRFAISSLDIAFYNFFFLQTPFLV